MKMFNGEAKPSSRIALRGQSRREPNLAEQKELIRKQRALRQKRALEQKSSTTIQVISDAIGHPRSIKVIFRPLGEHGSICETRKSE